MAQAPANRAGEVFLVGAGPGDPGLITVRGAECLARADLVLYDYLGACPKNQSSQFAKFT